MTSPKMKSQGPRGGFKFEGFFETPQRRISEPFKYEDGFSGTIDICYEVDSFLNYILFEDDMDFLKQKIADLWKSKYAIPFNDEYDEVPLARQSRIISLYDAAKILF